MCFGVAAAEWLVKMLPRKFCQFWGRTAFTFVVQDRSDNLHGGQGSVVCLTLIAPAGQFEHILVLGGTVPQGPGGNFCFFIIKIFV